MPITPIKIRFAHPDGNLTIRRAQVDSGGSYPSLVSLVQQRFQLAPDQPLELLYQDADGDHITISTDIELREYLESVGTGSLIVRLPSRRSEQSASASTLSDADPADVDDWELEDGEDAPGSSTAAAAEESHATPPTPTLIEPVVNNNSDGAATADPEETPLALPASGPAASIAERTRAMIDADFPLRPQEAADPVDEPLRPQPAAPADMPFTGLPSSFATLLSGLPSHAGALGTHVQSLLSSPQSALGRLSALAADPMGAGVGALDLSDLGRSIAQLSAHVSDAAREVVDGVRKEADAVRAEFDQLKAEVAREKHRFEEEVRTAMERAAQAPSSSVPRSTEPGATPARASQDKVTAATGSAKETADEDEDESSDEGEPEEPYSERTGSGRSVPGLERPTKEQRRLEREQRRQDREARREARKAEKAAAKAARREAKAALVAAQALYAASEQTAATRSGASSPPERPMSCMPGSLPVSYVSAVGYGVGSSPCSTPAMGDWASAAPSSRVEQHEDDGKPVLLTNLLLACDELGMDVRSPQLRIALTDIYCDFNGRGLSRMIERALDECCDLDD